MSNEANRQGKQMLGNDSKLKDGNAAQSVSSQGSASGASTSGAGSAKIPKKNRFMVSEVKESPPSLPAEVQNLSRKNSVGKKHVAFVQQADSTLVAHGEHKEGPKVGSDAENIKNVGGELPPKGEVHIKNESRFQVRDVIEPSEPAHVKSSRFVVNDMDEKPFVPVGGALPESAQSTVHSQSTMGSNSRFQVSDLGEARASDISTNEVSHTHNVPLASSTVSGRFHVAQVSEVPAGAAPPSTSNSASESAQNTIQSTIGSSNRFQVSDLGDAPASNFPTLSSANKGKGKTYKSSYSRGRFTVGDCWKAEISESEQNSGAATPAIISVHGTPHQSPPHISSIPPTHLPEGHAEKWALTGRASPVPSHFRSASPQGISGRKSPVNVPEEALAPNPEKKIIPSRAPTSPTLRHTEHGRATPTHAQQRGGPVPLSGVGRRDSPPSLGVTQPASNVVNPTPVRKAPTASNLGQKATVNVVHNRIKISGQSSGTASLSGSTSNLQGGVKEPGSSQATTGVNNVHANVALLVQQGIQQQRMLNRLLGLQSAKLQTEASATNVSAMPHMSSDPGTPLDAQGHNDPFMAMLEEMRKMYFAMKSENELLKQENAVMRRQLNVPVGTNVIARFSETRLDSNRGVDEAKANRSIVENANSIAHQNAKLTSAKPISIPEGRKHQEHDRLNEHHQP
eukprot:Nk52_evm34s1992 gene=Nk52_evmTU34s1992